MLIDNNIKKDIIEAFNEIQEESTTCKKITHCKTFTYYHSFLRHNNNLSNKITDYKVGSNLSIPYNKKKYDRVNLLQLVCLKNLVNRHTGDFFQKLINYFE